MSLELQKFIFESTASRRELLNYDTKIEKQYTIQVFRNHSFELVEHVMGVYLDYAEIGVTFVYSGYDDSLSFLELDSSTDLILLWIDLTRYDKKDISTFLLERIQQLRLVYSRPILLVPFGGDMKIQDSLATVFNLSGIEQKLGNQFLDERTKDIAGTTLSSKALLEIAKELGLRYIPALLKPSLKAIVVDLDNTLYRGVLGEDGVNGVSLTPGHLLLQTYLKELVQKGFFVCIASKNNPEDVDNLLERRADFPLKKQDFSKICVSWNPKAESIGEIAEFLNINVDSILFIDDNIGELTSVQMAFPNIKVIHALEDGSITRNILFWYPGMLKLITAKEDKLRKGDVQANDHRKALRAALSAEEYIRSLKLKLVFDFNNIEQEKRVFELANKTNQFIFSYQRYTLAEVMSRMRNPRYVILTISLSDKLSDSGLIGVCVGKKFPNYVEIEELFISCRALGRGIDEIIVMGAIQYVAQYFNETNVCVLFKKGDRNEPAERFVASQLMKYISASAEFHFELPAGLLEVEVHKK